MHLILNCISLFIVSDDMRRTKDHVQDSSVVDSPLDFDESDSDTWNTDTEYFPADDGVDFEDFAKECNQYNLEKYPNLCIMASWFGVSNRTAVALANA